MAVHANIQTCCSSIHFISTTKTLHFPPSRSLAVSIYAAAQQQQLPAAGDAFVTNVQQSFPHTLSHTRSLPAVSVSHPSAEYECCGLKGAPEEIVKA